MSENVTIEQVPKGRLAIWLLVAGELIIFGGFIACYLLARLEYGGAFPAAMIDPETGGDIILWYIGAINTTVLLVSSWSIVKAHEAAVNNDIAGMKKFSWITISLAIVFLLIKFIVEWRHDFHLGATLRSFTWLPEGDPIFADGGLDSVRTLFWSYYFLMTGFHGLHVIIGALAIFIVTMGARNGENLHRIELAGIYWHMVDLIWIFLFPLFYLAQ